MTPYWAFLAAALYVLLYIVLRAGLDATPQQMHLYAHGFVLLSLAIIWALIFRPHLERGRLPLRAMLTLVTILAAGLACTRFMLSLAAWL
jgi:hypothetical protein